MSIPCTTKGCNGFVPTGKATEQQEKGEKAKCFSCEYGKFWNKPQKTEEPVKKYLYR